VEVTGYGLVLAAVLVAALLAAMMLWALHFMNEFTAPPAHRWSAPSSIPAARTNEAAKAPGPLRWGQWPACSRRIPTC